MGAAALPPAPPPPIRGAGAFGFVTGFVRDMTRYRELQTQVDRLLSEQDAMARNLERMEKEKSVY
jgi:hypothetical protein